MNDWITWNGAAEVPEPVKLAKRLWVRWRDGVEAEVRIGIAVTLSNWQRDAFLWEYAAPQNNLDVIAFRVE